MWTMILVLIGLLSAGAAVYSAFRVHRFSFVKRIGEKHRVLAWLIAFLAVVVGGIVVAMFAPMVRMIDKLGG